MHAKKRFFLIILFLALAFDKNRCLAASENSRVYSDALVFYENYGSSRLVFHEGYFYYGSRGSAGSASGTRYGVSGQRFTIFSEDKKEYTCSVALDGSTPGSCKRISYKEEDGYKYSLYTIPYDVLFGRFQKKYPKVDFTELMYNHHLLIQADFYLCLILEGDSQGRILENPDGSISKTGKVYSDYEGISSAAPWSSATMEALQHYYDISLSIFQPSSYWVSFLKNHSRAKGTMEKESYQYGEKKGLNPCAYDLSYEIDLRLGDIEGAGDSPSFQKGRKLMKDVLSVKVQSLFMGWGKSEDGPVVYHDQERVMNLSKTHQAVIPLYGIWKNTSYELPDILDSSMFVRESGGVSKGWQCLKFLGWSGEPHPVLPVGSNGESIEDLLPAGSKVIADHDQVFYGVWVYEPCHFVWEEISSKTPALKQIHYSKKKIRKLRQSIKELGFMGPGVYGEMASGGLA